MPSGSRSPLSVVSGKPYLLGILGQVHGLYSSRFDDDIKPEQCSIKLVENPRYARSTSHSFFTQHCWQVSYFVSMNRQRFGSGKNMGVYASSSWDTNDCYVV
jgi:hypothetical protein